jgi:uncharacterized protein (DUF433 family)
MKMNTSALVGYCCSSAAIHVNRSQVVKLNQISPINPIYERSSEMQLPDTITLPLQRDEHGTIRVSNTRVTLDVIIARHQQGLSPEAIHEGFSSVPLTDIYAVLAYYVANREEVDVYLQQRDAEAERIRAEWETRNPPPTRAELLNRLDSTKNKQDD